MADNNGIRAALEIRTVSKAFGRKPVLRGISLTAAGGESIAMIGRNGAGKTTLLSIVSGAASPDKGDVIINGCSLSKRSERLDARRHVGFLPHDLFIYEDLTASENLEYFGRLWGAGGKDLKAEIERILGDVGLHGTAKKAVRAFSRGMQQRLAIARLILTDPAVWIMDEPFTGLDAAGRQWLYSLLRRETETGRLILFSTHSEEDVLNGAGRILVIKNGRLHSDAGVTGGDSETVKGLFSAGMGN
ncbi:MAG: heme ABC exporter ATP-binding protein CcmA [Deltaproteobacteria bacterium]|nr:heme ABC exporter ATP-binding protein CcmA [Deltaproteobacteria bacterium]